VCLLASLGVGLSSAQAQVAPPPSDSKWYAEFNFGPTLGHKGDKFVGLEAGRQILTPGLFVIVDVSHMGNVGTTDLDDRATIIANFLGGTATTAFKVNHGAVGLRYNIETGWAKAQPYVLGAVGAASVETQVEFNVNGTTIDPATRGVQLGGDLTGTHTKTILVFGFGVNVPFKTQFFADLGYRYGSILAKTANFETDKTIPTQRIVLGVGYRF
jgi:opacity protein-like surface antigen